MPSRNSVNKPKITAPKIRRTPDKGYKIPGTGLTTKAVAGSVTNKVISKKRAKKDQRNAQYTAEFNKARAAVIEHDLEMKDSDEPTSATQKKIRERKIKAQQQNAIKLNVQSDLPAEELLLTSSGEGTTLGQPPQRG